MKIRASKNPPWREYLPETYHYDILENRAVSDCGGQHRPDFNRPMRWHEFVRNGRVVLRSQKPAEVLLTVLGKGESLYAVKRRDRKAMVTTVTRKLIARRS